MAACAANYQDHSMKPANPSLLSRISLAFGTFFSIIADGQFAARVQALRAGEQRAEPSAPAAAAAKPSAPPLVEAAPDGALQLLGLLQREARFIDFIQEDIAATPTPTSAPPPASCMKAAARCCATTSRSARCAAKAEGSRVTLPAGFRCGGDPRHRQRRRPAAVHRQHHPPGLAGERNPPAQARRQPRPAHRRPGGGGTMSEPRFSIGIDLGTTHCALSYVDLGACDGEQVTQHVLPIPQLTAPGSVESLGLLPSFIYLPHASELAAGDLSLPWTAEQDYAVGEMARSRGAATPIRLVSSAKSWLCHAGVDRRAAILPNDAPPEVARCRRSKLRCAISPICAPPGTRRNRPRPSPSRRSSSPSPPPSTRRRAN
jgi:hypothetical protein